MVDVLVFSFFKYWGSCFYTQVMTLCTVPAADYVMKYLVDGWQPVLNHLHRCEFGKLYNDTAHLLLLLFFFLPSVSIPEGGLKIDENKLRVRAVRDRQAIV